MYRGTTPSFRFRLSDFIDVTEINNIFITFKSDMVQVDKGYDDLTISEGGDIICSLTQEETLKFYKGKTEIQARFIMNNGMVYATNIKNVDVGRILKEGEISAR